MTREVPQNPPVAPELWPYSLAVYGRDGVRAAALALQDGAGLDVNVLLWCLWAGLERRVALPAPTVAFACAAVAPWSAAAVRPLRQVRRWLKASGHPDAALVAELRRQVAAAELLAEQGAQAQLAVVALPAAEGVAPLDAAARNLGRYAGHAGVAPGGSADEDLARLLAAAAGVGLAAARAALARAAA